MDAITAGSDGRQSADLAKLLLWILDRPDDARYTVLVLPAISTLANLLISNGFIPFIEFTIEI